jgi:hypothetical protein
MKSTLGSQLEVSFKNRLLSSENSVSFPTYKDKLGCTQNNHKISACCVCKSCQFIMHLQLDTAIHGEGDGLVLC